MSAVDYESVIEGLNSLQDCDHDGDCTEFEADEQKFNKVFGENELVPDWMDWKSVCTEISDRNTAYWFKKCVDSTRGCNDFGGYYNDIEKTNKFGFKWSFLCRFPAPEPTP